MSTSAAGIFSSLLVAVFSVPRRRRAVNALLRDFWAALYGLSGAGRALAAYGAAQGR